MRACACAIHSCSAFRRRFPIVFTCRRWVVPREIRGVCATRGGANVDDDDDRRVISTFAHKPNANIASLRSTRAKRYFSAENPARRRVARFDSNFKNRSTRRMRDVTVTIPDTRTDLHLFIGIKCAQKWYEKSQIRIQRYCTACEIIIPMYLCNTLERWKQLLMRISVILSSFNKFYNYCNNSMVVYTNNKCGRLEIWYRFVPVICVLNKWILNL